MNFKVGDIVYLVRLGARYKVEAVLDGKITLVRPIRIPIGDYAATIFPGRSLTFYKDGVTEKKHPLTTIFK
jgi:hypothetical protein